MCTRELNGESIEFGTTGYTMDSIFVLYDRDSDSVWYPNEEGELNAVAGEHQGTAIEILEEPAPQLLSEWVASNPDTLVLMPTERDLAMRNRAYLGVGLEEHERGILLVSVREGSPAGKAGLEAGDILLWIGGAEVLSREELREILGDYSAGDSVMILRERDGEREEIKLTFEPRG